MATTELIQLKQTTQNKYDVDINGDYEVTLQQKIVVNPGDQIAVQQSFIDTSSIDPDSGMINIPVDCQLTIKNGLYIQDVLTSPAELFVNLDDTVREGNDFTGDTFIACFASDPGQPMNVINQITLTGVGSLPPQGQDPPDVSTNVTFSYTDPEDNPQKDTFNFDFGEITDKETNTFAIGKNITFKPGTMTVSNTTNNGVNSASFSDVSFKNSESGKVTPSPGLVEDTGQNFKPFEFTSTITVPASKYSPDNLVSTLNTLLQKNTPNQSRLVNSPFLATTSTDLPAKLQEVGVDPADQKEVFFVNKDATKIFKIDGTKGQFYVGTNDFAFGYEETQGVFTIDYAHFPFINNADGSNAIGLVKKSNIDNNTPSDYLVATKYSGIFFYGFSDNLDSSLIYSLMNFNAPGSVEKPNPLSITANIGQTDYNLGGIFTGTAPTFSFTEGVNVTTQLSTLDSFVDKRPGNLFYEPPVDNSNQITTNFFSQAPFTQAILANASALKNSLTSGYFMVEIQAQIGGGTVYTEGNTLKFIRQVVGRYFTQDSYTTGESGQIVYTHKSPESLIINSFRVRILDPSLNVASNLGRGTTVFLTHVKNPGMMTPLNLGEGKVGATATARTTM
jgi:hypothetical protein